MLPAAYVLRIISLRLDKYKIMLHLVECKTYIVSVNIILISPET